MQEERWNRNREEVKNKPYIGFTSLILDEPIVSKEQTYKEPNIMPEWWIIVLVVVKWWKYNDTTGHQLT